MYTAATTATREMTTAEVINTVFSETFGERNGISWKKQKWFFLLLFDNYVLILAVKPWSLPTIRAFSAPLSTLGMNEDWEGVEETERWRSVEPDGERVDSDGRWVMSSRCAALSVKQGPWTFSFAWQTVNLIKNNKGTPCSNKTENCTWFIKAKDIKFIVNGSPPFHQTTLILTTIWQRSYARNDCQMFICPSKPKENRI